ncbi:MAG: DUF45 domain-containing protein [Candidatus Cloacimonetes bacterium]|nr:DUF45 domain-containing protein [Candidatus Cloacimonadota bacterium]
MLKERIRTVNVEGIGQISLKKTNLNRNIRITVRSIQDITVTLPATLSWEAALGFIEKKKAWIQQARDKMLLKTYRIRELLDSREIIERQESREILTRKTRVIADKAGFSYNKLTIRCNRSRWGSCSARNNISLNLFLVLLPEHLQNYVILHELLHTQIKNHGGDFWRMMAALKPDYKKCRAELQDYPPGLIAGMLQR